MNTIRIALIIPHSDITLETDLRRELPDNYIIHTQRIWLDEVGEASEKKMVDEHLPRSIKYLKGITEFEAVVFGCTSASAVYGKEGLTKLEDYISNELSCKGKSAFGAVLKQLEKQDNNKVCLITPYTDEVNKFMIRVLEEFGYEIRFSAGMGLVVDSDIAEVRPDEIINFIESNMDDICAEVGTVFVSCTNFRSAEIRNEIESLLRMPVVTSNQSIIDWLLE
ncbi:MAG: maleate cis-trans isomerase family protein [Bacillota bacterium]